MTRLDAKQRTVVQLLGIVVFMGGLAWASIPLYDWFCRVTGFGGTTGVSDVAPDEILDKRITIKFDGSLARDMPWEFKPVEREMVVRIGETGLAFYEAYNPMPYPVAGTASYNVTPYATGGYFSKIQCFCFELQVLQPGERVLMPVTFYVDPEIVNDPEAKHASHITLSYTFHVTDMPEEIEEQARFAPEQPTTELN